MPGHPPIYVGLYVDDFIYFSARELVKTEFERRIKDDQKKTSWIWRWTRKVLGMKWQKISDNEKFTIHLLQEATVSALVEELIL